MAKKRIKDLNELILPNSSDVLPIEDLANNETKKVQVANFPISTATQTALNTKASTTALNTHTSDLNNPHAVTKAQVGLGNVDNTSDINKPISTAVQTALNGKQDSLGYSPENVANKSISVTTDQASNTKYPSVKSLYDWATGLFATITQLGTKQDTITGAATTITSSNLGLSKAVVSDASGKIAASTTTSTEIGYVSGVTSAIQTQIDGKQATLVSGTNIKTVNSNTLVGAGNVVIDKTSVGLGNVANVDTTNASNISSGTLADARLSANVTTQGNTFNTASKLVQLDATAKLPAVDGSQLTNLPTFSPPNGLLKLASAISTTLQTVTDYLGNLSVLQLNSRRVGVLSDSSVTTQTSAVIEAQTLNSNLVLKPNGTGAIVASIPDGTITGGNARGSNAVDLQKNRDTNDKVAAGDYSVITGGRWNKIDANSGVSFIGAGYNNRIENGSYAAIVTGNSNYINGALGSNHIIVGGNSNTTGGGVGYSFIGGGLSNNATNSGYGVIVGGANNTATSNYSTISGGQSNTASTNTHATVVGGSTNTASGQYSTVSGQSNTVSGLRSAIFGGSGNVLSGTSSSMIASTDSSCAGSNNSLLGGNLNFIGNGTSNSLGGGRSNSINNNVDYSFLGGGQSNVISGASGGADWGVIVGGQSNTIENTYTSILGGNNNYAFGLYSSVLGTKDAYSYLYGSVVLGGGLFSTRGDAQQSLLTARNSAALATGATLVLSLDGTGTTNLIIPNGTNRAWNVTIKTVAIVTTITGTATGVTVGDAYSEVKYLLFKKVGGTSSIVGTVDTNSIKSNTSMSTCAVTITAGASQELALTFTAPTFAGGGTVTCRVVARIELTEVAW